MSKRKAVALILLGKVFGKNYDDDTVIFMINSLDDMTDDEIERACKRAVRASKFMPSIAEIRELVAEEQAASNVKKPLSINVGKIDTRDKAFALAVRGDMDDLGMNEEQYEQYKKEEEERLGMPYKPPGFHPDMWNADGSPTYWPEKKNKD